jgi:hypothetical protein
MKYMQAIRSALLAGIAFVAGTVPAAAQTATPSTDNGPSLLWVWVWILVAGITVMIVGTSLGVKSDRR